MTMKKLLLTGLSVLLCVVCYGRKPAKIPYWDKSAGAAYINDTTGFWPADQLQAEQINSTLRDKYFGHLSIIPLLDTKKANRDCKRKAHRPISDFQDAFRWFLMCNYSGSDTSLFFDSLSYKPVARGFLFISEFNYDTDAFFPGVFAKWVNTWFVGFDHTIAHVRRDTIEPPQHYFNTWKIDSVAYSMRDTVSGKWVRLPRNRTDSIIYPIPPQSMGAFITCAEKELDREANNKYPVWEEPLPIEFVINRDGSGEFHLSNNPAALYSLFILRSIKGWIPGRVNGQTVPMIITLTATLDQEENPEYDSFDTDSWRKYLHRE